MSDVTVASAPKHRFAIFFASFMTLIAAGIGFAVRGSILPNWAEQYGFTKFELGTITGGGLWAFGVVILLASLITDRLGYKTILLLGFAFHSLSALLTLAATPVYSASWGGTEATFWCLNIGMWLFAIGNGLCEAVINPLVATLYPTRKTHYLNILHAGWPAGLVIGALFAKLFVGDDASVRELRWEIPMLFFLVPTLIYGLIAIKEHFPISEARAAGVSYGQMIAEFASPLLLFLLLLHACVGYVELGTDSWITTITDEITSAAGGYGLYLFIWASSIMFVLRFFAGPIVEKINPLGLLFISACMGCVGLLLIGQSNTLAMTFGAVTIYGLGKTFFWPTMLGVVGERFPRGGALTIGAMGGIGMLSAGLLGGPGIGFKQDYFASHKLQELSPPAFERYKAEKDNQFLVWKNRGLDGSKVAVVRDPKDPGTELEASVALLKEQNRTIPEVTKLDEWWADAKQFAGVDKGAVSESVLHGGRMALIYTAAVPAFMAIGYLILVIYFRAKGGYKQEHISGSPDPVEKSHGEEYTGGVPAPVR